MGDLWTKRRPSIESELRKKAEKNFLAEENDDYVGSFNEFDYSDNDPGFAENFLSSSEELNSAKNQEPMIENITDAVDDTICIK